MQLEQEHAVLPLTVHRFPKQNWPLCAFCNASAQIFARKVMTPIHVPVHLAQGNLFFPKVKRDHALIQIAAITS